MELWPRLLKRTDTGKIIGGCGYLDQDLLRRKRFPLRMAKRHLAAEKLSIWMQRSDYYYEKNRLLRLLLFHQHPLASH